MYIYTCIYISCKGARARVRRYKKAHCTHNMYIHLYRVNTYTDPFAPRVNPWFLASQAPPACEPPEVQKGPCTCQAGGEMYMI